MQPIDTAFDEGRFHYTQLERRGDIAIYRQDKPCQHLLYSGGAFARLYPVNPGSTRNHAAKTKRHPCVRYTFALDIWGLM